SDAGGMETPERRPWRRHLRFRVRVLIVFVLLVGGWLGWIVRSARIQRDAVVAIYDAGGFVECYDWGWDNGRCIPTAGEPWAPRWLVDRIGFDYFGHVASACLLPTAIWPQPEPDAVLVHLGRLGGLRELRLIGVPATDAGLAHLEGLTGLRVLDLSGT